MGFRRTDNRLVLFVTTAVCALSAISAVAADVGDSDPTWELVDWLKDNGALFSDKIELRHEVPDDPSTIRGVYATEDIGNGHVLFTIPFTALLQAPGPEYHYCETVDELYRQLQLPKEEMTPYLRYLSNQPRRYLPLLWSAHGKSMLAELFDGDNEDTPYPNASRTDTFYTSDCIEEVPDETYMHAWMLVRSRGDDEIMTPFYDMINHRNGRHYNTYTVVYDETTFGMIADKPIKAGQQIYNSYNQCNKCSSRLTWYDTIQLFINYGFLENYPRNFVRETSNARFKFVIDKDEDTDELIVDFQVPVAQSSIAFFRKEMSRLKAFETKYYETSDGNPNTARVENKPDAMPLLEWDNIYQLWQAMTEGYTAALFASIELDVSDDVWQMGERWYNFKSLKDYQTYLEQGGDDEDEDDEEE